MSKLADLPTIENSNTKEELALLKNILRGDDEELTELSEAASPKGSTCSRTRLQDFYLVLVAVGLFILLSNPLTFKILNAATGNSFLSYILAALIFGAMLYVIFIFMP